jgi:hypothetical protein
VARKVNVFGELSVTGTMAVPLIRLTLAAEIKTGSLSLLLRSAEPL